MRKPARGEGSIKALLPRVRREILAAAFMQPDRWWYLSDLAKHLRYAALPLAVGREASGDAAYFDACRRKRNVLSYDRADVATDTEAAELLTRARQFRRTVEAWIARQHPGFARNTR